MNTLTQQDFPNTGDLFARWENAMHYSQACYESYSSGGLDDCREGELYNAQDFEQELWGELQEAHRANMGAE